MIIVVEHNWYIGLTHAAVKHVARQLMQKGTRGLKCMHQKNMSIFSTVSATSKKVPLRYMKNPVLIM